MKKLLGLLFAFGLSSAYADTFIAKPALHEGVTGVTVTGVTTSLNVLSETVQHLMGSTTQIVALPQATTLKPGRYWVIRNDSSQNVTVRYFGGTTLSTVRPATSLTARLKSAVTSDGDWTLETQDFVRAAGDTMSGGLAVNGQLAPNQEQIRATAPSGFNTAIRIDTASPGEESQLLFGITGGVRGSLKYSKAQGIHLNNAATDSGMNFSTADVSRLAFSAVGGVTVAAPYNWPFIVRAADTMSGNLALAGPGTQPTTVVTMNSDRVLQSSVVTPTELGQLAGVSANVQTQINGKVAKAGDTMTGDLLGTRFLAADGSAGAPGIGFIGRASGMSVGTGAQLNVVHDGVQAISITTANGITVSRNISFGGNPSTDPLLPFTVSRHQDSAAFLRISNSNDPGASAQACFSANADSGHATMCQHSVAGGGDLEISSNGGAAGYDWIAAVGNADAQFRVRVAGTDRIAVSSAGLALNYTNATADRAAYVDSNQILRTSANVSSAELEFLDGVTSGVQGQVSGKVAKAGDTMTGGLYTLGGVTSIGLVKVINATNGALSIVSDTSSAGAFLQRTGSATGSMYLGVAGDRNSSNTYDEFQVRQGADTQVSFAMRDTDAGVQTLYWGASTDAYLQRNASGSLITPAKIGVKTGFSNVGGTIFTEIAGVTVANTTTETTMLGVSVGSRVIPANTLAVGDTIRGTFGGFLGCTSTPTLTSRFKFNASSVVAQNLTPANIDMGGDTENYCDSTQKIWNVDVVCTIRAIGASGSVMCAGGSGSLFSNNKGGAKINFGTFSTATIDTTATITLDFTSQWDAADAANQVGTHTAIIEIR